MKCLVTAAVLLGVVTGASPLAARDTPSVDLGYAVYEGTHNNQSGINVFKGYEFLLNVPTKLKVLTDNMRRIRYAAPPIGNLRFAAPQPPLENRTAPLLATVDGPFCPQSGAGKDTPPEYGFTSALGNEDCLYLNVYAPSNATNLPVFFWIRKLDLSTILIITNTSEMAVAMLFSLPKVLIPQSL